MRNRQRRTGMYTSIITVIAVLAIGSFLIGAGRIDRIKGSGKLIAESREVSNFDRIVLNGFGEVVITQGEEESLSVETDDNIMPYIATEVRRGTLYLEYDAKKVKRIAPTRLKFTLHLKHLVGLNIFGSGEISAMSLDTNDLDIDIDGSGDVQIDSLTAEKLEIRIDGSGKVTLAGVANGQDIKIDGSGKYFSGNLRSDTVKITLNGSGDTVVWATETLNAHINGSGSVNYYGSPAVDLSGSGSGKMKSLGDH
ncbi:MAG: DUF2807 domain-containing protein [bacterium]|nr:DUF2807 domain-containing protein [bacterium]